MPKLINVNSSVITEAIKKSVWFQGLPDEASNWLADHVQVYKYSKGETVLKAKQELKHVMAVLNGHLSFYFVGVGDQKFSILDFYSNFWFGESALLDCQIKILEVSAIQTSEIIFIPADEVRQIADQHLIVYRNLYYNKMRRVQLLYNTFTSVLTYPLKARLSLKILALIEERGLETSKGVCLSPSPKLEDWAKLSLGSEQRIELIFNEWKESGHIIFEKDLCFIPNPLFFEIEATK